MNSWSRMRKRIVLIITLVVVAALLGVPGYFLFHRTATCFDGIANGDESGVDCGGSCQRLCTLESLPLVIKGDPRVLTVATSTYEVAAVIENPNLTAEIPRAAYTVSLFAPGSLVPVKSVDGEAYIPPGQTFVVFEGPFNLEVSPTRATLEWHRETLVWEKQATPVPELTVEKSTFSRLETAPRLEVLIGNNSLGRVTNIDLTALVYDAGGNIFAAGKTFLTAVSSGEAGEALFTWPRSFAAEPVRVEIVTRVLPDQSYLK